jgi:threonine dehydrogenase-like Zn-dependent dehydrogenase
VVGCCLADLYEAEEFVGRVLRASGGGGEGGRERGREGGRLLVYLPITFAGQTALVPPAPAQDLRPPPSPFPASSLPSDAMAMEAYHHSLSHIQRHNLSPERLVHAMASHGAALIARGESPWRVEPDRDAYLWRCLAHFFGLGLLTTSAAFSSQGRGGGKGWDVGAWRRRLMERAPRIEVGNVDLLFRWGGGGGREGEGEGGGEEGGKGGEGGRRHVFVEFAGPRDVRCREEIWREKPALGSEEVEVDALCSLISSGTELKVYRGEIPQGEEAGEVDVNIKGMAGETLAYPLRYGYALVGRVVRCGADVADRERLMGREGGGEGAAPLVFAFSPHASRAVVAASSLLVVPPGILAEDAVYFPSVETALSLVQDARPLAGERVTVVGAGLIGLLVLAVLKRFPLGSLRAVDPLMVRRHLARRMGASVAVDPGMLRTGKKKEGAGDEGGGGMEEGGDRREAGGGEEGAWEEDGVHEADTSIEVSGVAAGLQTAIDQTGYGGKVVIGSWYGNHETPAALRLGLAFHRSHLRLYVSQVSRISTELQDRWTKARRYQTAWRLLKEIRPSTTLTSRVVAPEQVKEAFHALDTQPAETLAVMIDYRMKEGKARNKGAGDK